MASASSPWAATEAARIFDVSLARPLSELLAIASTRQTRQLSPDEARRFIH